MASSSSRLRGAGCSLRLGDDQQEDGFFRLSGILLPLGESC